MNLNEQLLRDEITKLNRHIMALRNENLFFNQQVTRLEEDLRVVRAQLEKYKESIEQFAQLMLKTPGLHQKIKR